jgi:hypothetical protein
VSGGLRVEDRIAIQDVLYRYARGVDRRDWELVRSVYHPDATDDHGGYRGGVDGLLDYLRARHEHIEQSLHVITNCLVEFDGPDSALVESCFVTFQRVLPDAGAVRLRYRTSRPLGDDEAVQGQAVGRYVDRLERRDGVWRIARRTTVYEVYRGEPAPVGGGLEPGWTQARRDGHDPVEVQGRSLGRGR